MTDYTVLSSGFSHAQVEGVHRRTFVAGRVDEEPVDRVAVDGA